MFYSFIVYIGCLSVTLLNKNPACSEIVAYEIYATWHPALYVRKVVSQPKGFKKRLQKALQL